MSRVIAPYGAARQAVDAEADHLLARGDAATSPARAGAVGAKGVRGTRPRRVAFLVNTYPVLTEIFILNAAVGLARAGVAVDIVPIYGRLRDSAVRHAVQDEIEAHPEVRVRSPLFPWRPRRRALAAPREMARLVGARGWRGINAVSPMHLGAEALSLRPLMVAGALAEALVEGEEDYDVVHCQFGTIAPLAIALRRAGLLRGRVVVHFRGYDISQYVRTHGEAVYADVFREADWFIANCRWFEDRAIALGCDPSRTSVVTSATDVERFHFRERVAPADGPTRLLAVGRLVEKKGFSLAVDALRMLVDRGVDADLTIVGEGPERAALEEATAAHRLQDRVTFRGERAHHEIVDELLRAHIFLAPSRTAADGDQDAPVNAIKEAMATGAPVVASRHGGIPEIVEHGSNGFLAAENDAADLAAQIEAVARAPERWAEIGRAGRRTVETQHSLEASTARLLEAYENALATASHSR